MCHNDSNTNKRKWKQLTWENRILIEHLYNIQKMNYTQIAKEIGVHRTTISREIKLGYTEFESSYKTIWKYCANIAQDNNELNETAKGPPLKIGSDIELAKYIEKEIKRKISPEVIGYKIKTNPNLKTKIHWKTIYNYIDKNILMVTRKNLAYGRYKKKQNNNKKENEIRKYNKKGKTIHDRAKEIDQRTNIGHWEMDLVEGLKGKKEPYLLVLSERKSRKEKMILIPDKSNNSVIKALNRIEKEMGVINFRNTFKTITTDNGTEFQNWKRIEMSYTKSKKRRTIQYFADAYSSWQRGTNENINKMIRRFLPKGTSFKNLTKEEVLKIENWINNYPRKMFNFKTSEEIYTKEMKTA